MLNLFERVRNLTQTDYQSGMVVINQESCDGCKTCVQVCPASALELNNRKARMIAGVDCVSCGDCQAACPTDSIRIANFWNIPTGAYRTSGRRQVAGTSAYPRLFPAPVGIKTEGE